MSPTTAQPVGANLLAATQPGISQETNAIVGESGQPLKTFYANPNDVLNSTINLAELSDLTNRQINANLNPVASNLKQQVQQNVTQQYGQQMALAQNSGAGSANSVLQNAAAAHGLGNIFQGGAGSAPSAGQASLQSAIGQGVIGANAYQQNLMNAANSNANGLVASTYGQYAPSGSSLENLDLGQQQNFVANQNAATQNLLINQMGAANAFQGTINNAANQLQSVSNNNAAAANQASAANLGFASGLLSDAGSLAGSAIKGAGVSGAQSTPGVQFGNVGTSVNSSMLSSPTGGLVSNSWGSGTGNPSLYPF
jgi:hypothetical protein